MTARLQGEAVGRVLVALQFSLLGWLAWLASHAHAFPIGPWVVAASSLLLGLWALTANQPGNFNVRPTPRPGGQMISAGPYRWIRHPMYSAVSLFGLACAWASESTSGWMAFALLSGVLVCKSTMEERWMQIRHPDYHAYKASTARFIPGLF